MTIDDMEQNLLADYRELHNALSKMVEDGRLSGIAQRDYDWLVETLAQLASDGDRLDKALDDEDAAYDGEVIDNVTYAAGYAYACGYHD